MILVLWAVPRSTSTAFEWMMRNRGDMTCYHEPFGRAWHFGETPLWPAAPADAERIPGLSLESVLEELKRAAQDGPVFSKDFPYYVDHWFDDEFMDLFNHSFLIRDPARALPSLEKILPDFPLKEGGFPDQRRLFDLLTERDGKAPPVIDSDDLLEDPEGIVAAYCEAVGIAYMPEALRWQPGERREVCWWDQGSSHVNLARSDGLKPQKRSYPDVSRFSKRLDDIYRQSLPHYEHLYAQRLKPVSHDVTTDKSNGK